MKVDFNNMRRQGLKGYIRLTEKLNANIKGDKLVIDVDEIEKEMDAVRMSLVCIAFTFDEGNADFKDLSEEFPNDIIGFNENKIIDTPEFNESEG